MYIDFHTHGKLAKKLPFSTVYTDWLFGEARRAGLHALCLTEHFNTLQFDELYGYLLSSCERQGDTLVLSKENLKGGTLEELRLWLTEKCRLPIVVLDSHWKVIERVESNQKKENPQ